MMISRRLLLRAKKKKEKKAKVSEETPLKVFVLLSKFVA